jgi:hypothetical protein
VLFEQAFQCGIRVTGDFEVLVVRRPKGPTLLALRRLRDRNQLRIGGSTAAAGQLRTHAVLAGRKPASRAERMSLANGARHRHISYIVLDPKRQGGRTIDYNFESDTALASLQQPGRTKERQSHTAARPLAQYPAMPQISHRCALVLSSRVESADPFKRRAPNCLARIPDCFPEVVPVARPRFEEDAVQSCGHWVEIRCESICAEPKSFERE